MAFPTFRAWLVAARLRAWPVAARLRGGGGRWVRPLRAALFPPLFGPLFCLGMLGLALGGRDLVPADETLLGKSAKDISSFVAVRFAPEIRRIGLGLTLLAVLAGLGLGLGALALVAVARAVRARPPSWAGPTAAAFVPLLHALALGASMARWPQLYAPAFYDRRGVLAAIEVGATTLGPLRVTALLGLVGAALVVGPPRGWRRRTALVPAGLALALGGAALATRPAAGRGATATPVAPGSPAPAPGPSPRRRPSVLVLASDGLRPDRLVPATAPRLAELVTRGTRFDRAYATLPRTYPSWTTLLTGQYAWHHGIRSGFARAEESAKISDTLPRRLRDAGYRTAVVSDYAGDVFTKADFGFDVTRAPSGDFVSMLWQRGIAAATPLLPFLQTSLARHRLPPIVDMAAASDPDFVADDALDVLRDVDDATPFFLVVFFSTTHFPYAAPAPYFAKFTDPAYRGPFRYEKQVSARVPITPDPADVRQIRGLYDGAVAAVDAAAGRILDELARRGRGEDTIVVVTSDHGETLFEHDRWHGHGAHLFGDEGTHVPLAIVDPRAPEPRRVSEIVSNVDFAPTLAELVGVAPPADVDGRSLAAALHGAPVPPGIAFAETELWLGEDPAIPRALQLPSPPLFELLEVDEAHGAAIVLRKRAKGPNLVARHRMARDERFKLLYMPTPTGIEWRLFDTERDPDELVDVKAEHPEELARLRRALLAWLARDPALHVE